MTDPRRYSLRIWSLLAILALVLFSACAPAVVPPTSTPAFTPTPIPSATSAPTATPIPQAVRQAIEESYRVAILIQANVYLLSQAAERTSSGEGQGLQSSGALIATAALVNGVEENLPNVTPQESFQPHWDSLMAVHEKTKEIIARWVSEEMDAERVKEEAAPLLEESERILSAIERDLAQQYGIDQEAMTSDRQEMIESLKDAFNTPTPTANP